MFSSFYLPEVYLSFNQMNYQHYQDYYGLKYIHQIVNAPLKLINKEIHHVPLEELFLFF